MKGSLDQILTQVARRGSWFGGGSVSAMSTALAAALLEKLVLQDSVKRRLRRLRKDCLKLAQSDADVFAKVVRAARGEQPSAFRRILKKAIQIPLAVFGHAQTVRKLCELLQGRIRKGFQSDLRCALALALAYGEGARTLILTNLAWLDDPRYTKQIRARLQRLSRGGSH